MDAETILETVRAGNAPSEWNVWPLRRQYVRSSALKWSALGLVGFALLIPVLIIMVPDDIFRGDSYQKSFAVVAILLVGWMAFGSLWIVVEALLRLRRATSYWLVITPDVFVKAQPNNLYSIPLEQVGDITLKGVSQAAQGTSPGELSSQQMLAMGGFAGIGNQLGMRPRRASGPASLAFRDRRDNRVIVVSTDGSFDHLGALYEILSERVGKKEEAARRSAHPLGKYASN
jgi:hypothetical protein